MGHVQQDFRRYLQYDLLKRHVLYVVEVRIVSLHHVPQARSFIVNYELEIGKKKVK